MSDFLHKELTYQIIGVYYDVYNGLGRTYPEFVYKKAMLRDLRRRGVVLGEAVSPFDAGGAWGYNGSRMLL